MSTLTLMRTLSAMAFLASGLVGCKRNATETGPLAPQTLGVKVEASPAPPAPAPSEPQGQAKADPAQVGELREKLRAADVEVSRAKAWAESLRRDMEEDRKTAAAQEERFRILRVTLEALQERLQTAGQGDWVLRCGAAAFENQKDVEVKSNERATDGKALLLGKPTSTAETVISVKAGCYRVVPVGLAPDPDHDAMNLTVKAVDKDTGDIDIEKRVCFDQNFEAFADASGVPTIVVRQSGKIKVVLQPTEETGMSVDRVELRVAVPPQDGRSGREQLP